MMNLLKRYQGVIGILAIAIAGFIAYSVFFKGSDAPPLSQEDVSAAKSAVDQELIALLLTLKTITLDTALFDDPAFKSLKDFSQELVPEPVGRPNPFAPLEGAE